MLDYLLDHDDEPEGECPHCGEWIEDLPCHHCGYDPEIERKEMEAWERG